VTFTKAGASNWGGIALNSGGTLNVGTGLTVEDATEGISFLGGVLSNGTNKVTVQDCSSWGVRVYDSTPTIKYVHLENTNGFAVAGGLAHPIIENVTIHDGNWGLYLSNASAYMITSNITCYNDYDSVFLLNSDADVILENASDIGSNNIHPKSGEQAIGRSSNSAYIDADFNWWGESNPPTSLFDDYANVDYSSVFSDSVTTSGAGKIVSEYAAGILAQAWDSEERGEYATAFDLYRQLLQEAKTDQYRRRYVKNILRVTGKSGEMFSELSSLIKDEFETASPGYGAFLDYVLCNIPLMMGNAGETIARLESKMGDYTGTPMEQEMLCKLATVYAYQLNDKQKAEAYAKRAAYLNPGNPLLDIAYNACGIEYNSSDFTDTSLGYQYVEKPVSPEDPLTEKTLTPSVAVSPNPANPATTISYTIAKSARVTLAIYSVTGQKVATLVDRTMPAGRHSVVFDGSSLASGVYFYRLETPGFAKTGKMLLVK